MSGRDLVKRTAAKKGWIALGTGVAGVAAGFLWWPLALVGLGAAGYFTYDWFKYRGKNGLRF